MPLTSIDTSTVAAILAQLAAENIQALEADFLVLAKRYPTLPWRDILSAMGGGVGSTTTPGNFRLQDGVSAALATVAAPGALGNALLTQDLGGVSNPALFDATSAANAALNTGTLDVSTWRALLVEVAAGAGTTQLTVRTQDDTSTDLTVLDITPAALAVVEVIGPGAQVGSITNGRALPISLPRFMRLSTSAAGVGNAVRMRITGRR